MIADLAHALGIHGVPGSLLTLAGAVVFLILAYTVVRMAFHLAVRAGVILIAIVVVGFILAPQVTQQTVGHVVNHPGQIVRQIKSVVKGTDTAVAKAQKAGAALSKVQGAASHIASLVNSTSSKHG